MSINDQWERIETAFADSGIRHALNDPASPEAIDALEAELGLTLPDELRDSLLRHDGTTDGDWPYGALLGTDGIQAEAKVWRELVEDGTFDDAADHDASNGQGSVKPGWWNVGWIPLDADGGGNGSVVDTDPGENGVVGQVLDMDHEVGPSGPRFASVTEYLKDIADRIESGALRWDGGAWEEF